MHYMESIPSLPANRRGGRIGQDPEAVIDPLARAFYERPARDVAIDLLGRRLLRTIAGPGGHRTLAGTIVETEAYVGAIDLACHGSRGRTPRTATMFGPPGHAYVYLIYGMYHCLNVVTAPDGEPCAVLVRAVALDATPSDARPHPGSGPGRLCRALEVTRRDDTADLCDPASPLVIVAGDRPASRPHPDALVRHGPRIGMGRSAGEWAAAPLRFWFGDHPAVSGTRGANRAGAPVEP